MEKEQNVVPSEKNNVLIKLLIALFTVFSIVQISVVFIPAMIGQPTVPFSLFGSILWPGLLFVSIWSLRNKRKFIGFLIGALIGVALHFSAGMIAGYFQAEPRAIDKAIATSNEGLPKMMDDGTRLDSVSVDQEKKLCSLNITLVDSIVSDIDIVVLNDHFEQSIKPSTCNIQEFKLFFAEGYTVNYVYKDKNDKLISKYSILPSDCK